MYILCISAITTLRQINEDDLRKLSVPPLLELLPITDEQIHRPEHCALCNTSLASVVEEHAYTARSGTHHP